MVARSRRMEGRRVAAAVCGVYRYFKRWLRRKQQAFRRCVGTESACTFPRLGSASGAVWLPACHVPWYGPRVTWSEIPFSPFQTQVPLLRLFFCLLFSSRFTLSVALYPFSPLPCSALFSILHRSICLVIDVPTSPCAKLSQVNGIGTVNCSFVMCLCWDDFLFSINSYLCVFPDDAIWRHGQCCPTPSINDEAWWTLLCAAKFERVQWIRIWWAACVQNLSVSKSEFWISFEWFVRMY